MDYKKVERKINDIELKCPIEAGVEILVYNILDYAFDSENLSVVDINSIWKNKDSRLTSDYGIADIALLSNDFVWSQENKGKVYGVVEVKYLDDKLDVGYIGHITKYPHFLYTNGLKWIYYYNGNENWTIEINEDTYNKYTISEDRYKKLIELLKDIKFN
ncbi:MULTISPECIES: hypothetical protein [Helcococcus]|uniref:Uncharacterized protein n=1 Tax=Helcococcus bovis TaxID=3153252 RepID=A0ABW9F5U9_9FIRM